jgi:hypothetical protein
VVQGLEDGRYLLDENFYQGTQLSRFEFSSTLIYMHILFSMETPSPLSFSGAFIYQNMALEKT